MRFFYPTRRIPEKDDLDSVANRNGEWTGASHPPTQAMSFYE
jgi:hypothetical protein